MTDLRSLARNGVLHVAINTGNRALVKAEGDILGGVSPALGRRLAEQIGARFEPVIYDGAGKVFEDAGADRWDVAFLAIDPMRAERVSFTRPYHVIEATYAVRADSGLNDPEDADQEGVRVLTSVGSAYDMYLRANLSNAKLDREGTPTESFQRFRGGAGDAVAGVRASLDRFFSGDETVRVLPGVLTKVEQAMVLNGPAHPSVASLDTFVSEAISSGFVADQL